MRKIAILCLRLFFIPLFVVPVFAQETHAQAPEAHFYHLDFVVKELGDEGKVVNSRTYLTTISTEGMSSVRTGTKIPLRTNDKGEINYIDVGINIDCQRVHEAAEGLAMQISAEISSLATPIGTGNTPTPIIRQNRWQSATVLPIGKPSVVFSSDNLENKGKMQVEVTATPMH
ncbi:MAG: hypothetical protein WAK33_07320 [Silvibacterium sp.]